MSAQPLPLPCPPGAYDTRRDARAAANRLRAGTSRHYVTYQCACGKYHFKTVAPSVAHRAAKHRHTRRNTRLMGA